MLCNENDSYLNRNNYNYDLIVNQVILWQLDNAELYEFQKSNMQKRGHDKIKVDSCVSALYAIIL